MFNSYSELNFHNGYQISIKSGLFGNKVVYRDTKKGIKMPQKSKVKIKPAESGVKLYVKGKELSPDIFYEIWFRDQYMFASHGESGRTIKIDCLTGNHTPISEDIRTDYRGVNYCIDYDGNIFRINPDCTTIDLGLVRVNEDDHSVHMLCKKPNGKYILMDMETLEPIMANEFDNENVTCTLLNRINRTPILRVVSDGRNHYFIDKNYNVIKEIECDSVTVLNEYVMAISCYDEKTNKSSILKFDLMTKELTDWFEVNNNALKIGRKDNQIYVITSDKNNKVGVVDEKDNSIIPNQYDSIENIELSSIQQDKNKFTTIKESMFCAQKDGKKGLFSMDGKNILPCDYKDIIIDFSYKLLDDYRFLAQDDKGNYGIVSANGKAETDFIYKLARDLLRDSISRVCSKTESEKDPNGQKNYYYGLELKNTKTGGIDYFLQGAKNVIIEAKDADVYYAGHESSEGVHSHKVPMYTQDEIFRAGVILSTVLDSGAGMHIADVIMSNETIDKIY